MHLYSKTENALLHYICVIIQNTIKVAFGLIFVVYWTMCHFHKCELIAMTLLNNASQVAASL